MQPVEPWIACQRPTGCCSASSYCTKHTTCVQLLHKAYSMCTVIAQSIQRMLKVSSQMHALHLLTYKSIIIHLITFKQKTIHDHLMRTQQ